MRLLLTACAALLCCTTATAQQSLNAEVDRIGADQFRIRITFPGVVTPDQAQQMLTEVGASLCNGQAPAWGHYKFETQEPISGAHPAPASTKFEQDLGCNTGMAESKPGTPAPKTPADDAERRAIEVRTLDYLLKKDQGDFVAADAMFEVDAIASFDRATWRDARRSFNRDAGMPAARAVVDITFYDDPADAPTLGRYAAVDYRARYNSQAFYCGYVVWLRQADGGYRLVREDESLATDAIVRASSEEQLASLKGQPGCREPG